MAYCKTDAQATAEIEEFVATSAGMTLLGQWGAQCAFYAQHYAKILFGLSPYETLGYGHANALLAGASPEYFTKTWNDPTKPDLLPRRGDLIIWRGLPLWDGGIYGHIAVVTSVGKTTVTVQQLDGAAAPTRVYPDGYSYSVKPVHTATFAYVGSAAVGNVLGWMRPRTSQVRYTGADTRGYGPAPQKAAVAAPKTVAPVARHWIDVSDFQPTSTIASVQTDAVSIKATEGNGWQSRNMAGHIAAARAEGIRFSLYHFARSSLGNTPEAEADWFLRVAGPYLDDPLLDHLVLDWEEDDQQKKTWWAELFLRRLQKKAPGTRRVLYARVSALSQPGWTAFGKGHTVWLAWYGHSGTVHGYATDWSWTPDTPAGWTVGAWQYTDEGRLHGYSGDLDLNVSLDVRADMTMWTQPQKAAAAKKQVTITKDWSDMATKKEIKDSLAEVLADLEIPAKGDSEGDMKWIESAGWDRHERARMEDRLDQVDARLDVLGMAFVTLLEKMETR